MSKTHYESQKKVAQQSDKKILLVDDSSTTLLIEEMVFREHSQYGIVLARNGEEAISYLRGDSPYNDRARYPLPAIMLLDLNMPRKSGFDVLAWVRSQPKIKRLTVIILTASMRNEDVERAFDLGASSFLVKPSDLNALSSMMRCLCEWVRINHFPPLGEVHPARVIAKGSIAEARIRI